MVQLEILSGKTAGTVHSARRFPFVIGRGVKCNLRIEEDGVWERHATLSLDRGKQFILKAEENALVSINGEPASECFLRNGDHLAMGSVRARFWLSSPRQRSLWPREALVWTAVVLVTLAQLAVIYYLS